MLQCFDRKSRNVLWDGSTVFNSCVIFHYSIWLACRYLYCKQYFAGDLQSVQKVNRNDTAVLAGSISKFKRVPLELKMSLPRSTLDEEGGSVLCVF